MLGSLQVLVQKDQQIKDLEQQVAQLAAENEKLNNSCEDAQLQLMSSKHDQEELQQKLQFCEAELQARTAALEAQVARAAEAAPAASARAGTQVRSLGKLHASDYKLRAASLAGSCSCNAVKMVHCRVCCMQGLLMQHDVVLQTSAQLLALQQEAARLAAELASADIRARHIKQTHESELAQLAAANADLTVKLQQALQAPPQPQAASPSHPEVSAVMQRVQQLEASNERLEQALKSRPATPQRALSSSTSELTHQQQELFRLRDAGHEKDREIATLTAELAVARSAAAAAAEGKGRPAGDAHALQVEAMKQEVAVKERQARSLQERLVAAEAAQAVSQQAASRAEQELQLLQEELARSQQEARRLASDADIARQTAARLNARVSELALAEQSARAEAGSVKQQQGRQHQQHQQELADLQDQMQHLHEQLERFMGGSSAAGAATTSTALRHPSPVRTQPPQGSSAPASMSDISPVPNRRPPSPAARALPSPLAVRLSDEREQMLKQAVEEAESAVAVMQSKLMEAERRRLEMERRLAEQSEEQQEDRVRLEQQVRSMHQ